MALSADLSNGLKGEFDCLSSGSRFVSGSFFLTFAAVPAVVAAAVAAARLTEREAGLLTGGLCLISSFLASSMKFLLASARILNCSFAASALSLAAMADAVPREEPVVTDPERVVLGAGLKGEGAALAVFAAAGAALGASLAASVFAAATAAAWLTDNSLGLLWGTEGTEGFDAADAALGASFAGVFLAAATAAAWLTDSSLGLL